jgi:hypothetical protein
VAAVVAREAGGDMAIARGPGAMTADLSARASSQSW